MGVCAVMYLCMCECVYVCVCASVRMVSGSMRVSVCMYMCKGA